MFRLCHGELYFNEMMMSACTRQTHLVDFFIGSSLRQQSTDRHVTPPRHIILIPSQPIFALSL